MDFLLKTTGNSDMAVALGVVAILIVMVLPLPAFLMDILLSMSIALSLVLLLTAVYTAKALDFSVFPSLLLVTTLFRLSLSVATTRLILLHGSDRGIDAAGNVIKSFGEFVVGGNYAVGIIVFIILVIINFIVITKGAGRVAEVAARFTLDAMPGKQMSIDADLNAGVINEEEARRRRQEIAREADFYGAMDGASKFVRGDAIAGIMIVFVNIIGGIIIGTIQNGKSLEESASIYTLLTVGDGLVTQIPALIISTAAGMIVTRTASGGSLGKEFSVQLLAQPKAVAVASLVMLVMALVPGLPTLPFLVMAIGTGALAYRLNKKEEAAKFAKSKREEVEKLKPAKEKLESLLPVDILELEVGYGLISIVDADQNGELLERITHIRKQFALDMGVIIPPLRIRDNLQLKPGEYVIQLKGVQIGQGELMVDHLLAMDPGNVGERISGVATVEPAFGLAAIWITAKQKDQAAYLGYTVVDLSTVIATHLTELIRKHAQELLGRQELQNLIDVVKQNHPKVVEELIPNLLPVGVMLKVCQNLLKEAVSIRDLRTIMEVLADHAGHNKDAGILTEYCRASLGRSITKKLLNPEGELPLLTLDRTIEEKIAQGVIQTDQGPQLSLDPNFVQNLVRELNSQSERMVMINSQAVLLVSPIIRSQLRLLVEKFIPHLVVLSHNEISSNIPIKSFATVRLSYAS
ncbi:MAG: flagellar biosynthesis protein FlhA [Deltaproteobacteria bacterium]|nr:flagellar biosynthesis protein FlhA [Deltaproteobacteria bacterium]